MAIKKDYKNSDLRTKYKDLVKRQTLTKITVVSEEQRSRAELLDMIEELFLGKQKRVDTEKLRAILTMLVLANGNLTDDTFGATQEEINAINANTAKVTQGLNTANHTLQFNITNTKGNYALVITIVDSSAAKPVTKTATINLR
tara:strand:- start:657 stop:1088 length:432 start_codon:yes stop_codon:yes gene_type:complete